MPPTCQITNVFTGDTIGYIKTIDVWATNATHAPLKLQLVDAHGGIAPGWHQVPPGTPNGAIYSFNLTHNQEYDGDPVTAKLTSVDESVTHDTHTVTVNVRAAADEIAIGVPLPPPPGGMVPVAGGVIPAQRYRGTFTPDGPNTVIVEVVAVELGGNKQVRVVALKEADRTVRLNAGQLQHVWQVGLPAIPTGGNLVVLRAYLLDWQGSVSAVSSRVIS